MATPQIGSISFLKLEGRVTPIAETLESFRRPGVDGVGLWKTGKTAPQSTIMTECDVVDAAGAASHISSCKALAGTLVTVTHGDGTSASNVAVMGPPEVVTSIPIRLAVGGVNSGSTLIVRLRWTLQATA